MHVQIALVAACAILLVACSGRVLETGDAGSPLASSSSGSAGSSSGGTSMGSSSGVSSSSGDGSGSSSGNPSSDCDTAAPPIGAARGVSLSMTGGNFGGSATSDWRTIGYNLDGKCTDAQSADACSLRSGASASVQDDGVGGIDNSFGENICPTLESLAPPNACSTGITSMYLRTDNTGAGRLALQVNGNWLAMNITDAYVTMNGASGTLAGVVSTSQLVAAFESLAGSISPSLCSGFQPIASQVAQASDILANGSDAAGSQCTAVSVGVQFTGAAAYDGSLPVVSDPCIADASTD
jgi:hypothetical protein